MRISHQSVSHSFRASGGGLECRSCEIRASFHMCINTDPTRRWRFVMGWSELCGWKWLCFITTPACMCTFLHCTFMIHVDTQMSGKKICIAIYLFFPWQKQTFLSHTAIKSKTMLAWRDSKHVSWKIYGSLELNCAGLLLEKDRWGLSRDMFYRFDFRCMFSYWRNATCVLL